MFAIEERLFFSKLFLLLFLLFLLLLLSLSIWFAFLWEKLREIISDNVADCVSAWNVFEKQENKKVKHTQQKTKNYTEIMIILSYVRIGQQAQLGHIMWIALRFLWDSIERGVGVDAGTHRGVVCPYREGGNETPTSLLAGKPPWPATPSHPHPENSPPHTHAYRRLLGHVVAKANQKMYNYK